MAKHLPGPIPPILLILGGDRQIVQGISGILFGREVDGDDLRGRSQREFPRQDLQGKARSCFRFGFEDRKPGFPLRGWGGCRLGALGRRGRASMAGNGHHQQPCPREQFPEDAC